MWIVRTPFRGIPNDKTRHFGESLLVGPLEPAEATKLIKNPCSALGIEFEQDAVLHILSYTNYHPALIQSFCEHIVEDVLRRRKNTQKRPIIVTKDEVDDLYRREPAIRGGIRKRFEWTLALDPHYQAVVWTIIISQTESQPDYGKEYGSQELLTNVRSYWSYAFPGNRDELAGILQSMVGLGVLTSRGGKFRLRSPNLVSLMGGPNEILDNLGNLADRSPESVFDPGSIHRVRLKTGDHKTVSFSPLTIDQESRLCPEEWGVSIILGSQMNGLRADDGSIFEEIAIPHKYLSIAAEGHTPKSFEVELKKVFEDSRKTNKPTLVRVSVGNANLTTVQLIEKATEFVRKRRSSTIKTRLKLVFVLDTEGFWTLLEAATSSLLSDEVNLVVAKPMNENGLASLLSSLDLSNNVSVVKRLILESGGWFLYLKDLIGEFFKSSTTGSSKALEQWSSKRKPLDDKLSICFRRSLGLENLAIRRFLRAVLDANPPFSEMDMTNFEVLSEYIGLSKDECFAAFVFCESQEIVRHSQDYGGYVVDPKVAEILQDGIGPK